MFKQQKKSGKKSEKKKEDVKSKTPIFNADVIKPSLLRSLTSGIKISQDLSSILGSLNAEIRITILANGTFAQILDSSSHDPICTLDDIQRISGYGRFVKEADDELKSAQTLTPLVKAVQTLRIHNNEPTERPLSAPDVVIGKEIWREIEAIKMNVIPREHSTDNIAQYVEKIRLKSLQVLLTSLERVANGTYTKGFMKDKCLELKIPHNLFIRLKGKDPIYKDITDPFRILFPKSGTNGIKFHIYEIMDADFISKNREIITNATATTFRLWQSETFIRLFIQADYDAANVESPDRRQLLEQQILLFHPFRSVEELLQHKANDQLITMKPPIGDTLSTRVATVSNALFRAHQLEVQCFDPHIDVWWDLLPLDGQRFLVPDNKLENVYKSVLRFETLGNTVRDYCEFSETKYERAFIKFFLQNLGSNTKSKTIESIMFVDSYVPHIIRKGTYFAEHHIPANAETTGENVASYNHSMQILNADIQIHHKDPDEFDREVAKAVPRDKEAKKNIPMVNIAIPKGMAETIDTMHVAKSIKRGLLNWLRSFSTHKIQKLAFGKMYAKFQADNRLADEEGISSDEEEESDAD
jgi:hypothetical protein